MQWAPLCCRKLIIRVQLWGFRSWFRLGVKIVLEGRGGGGGVQATAGLRLI